jgi:Trk K+ transport system NAD-binding subunit/nucleotide-binding universal stress UspA family protein
MIELDPGRCETAARIEGVEAHCGDVTSTLILKRANVQGASHVVTTIRDDEVNLEFCRLMREQFGAHNLVALAHSEDAAKQLRATGTTAVSRSASVATILESSIDEGRRTASDIGLGKGEICQVTVQSHSPVIGKTPSQLRPQSWLLGAIYREGRLVVPHGNTTIRAGDKCLLVGEPGILQGIADYFQRGSSEFPLQFGTRICLVDDGPAGCPDVQECRWLKEHTEAQAFALLHRGPGPTETLLAELGDNVEVRPLLEGTAEEYTRLNDELDCAVTIASASPPGWMDSVGWGNRQLLSLLDHTSEPVLVSRGSFPYRKLLVAVSPSPGSLRASELAVDVARKLDADLTAVAVEPPEFVVGSDYKQKLSRALDAVKATAHLYSRRVETRLLEGNPVNRVLEVAEDFDLLIVGHRRLRRFSLTRPDVSRHLITRSTRSVMVLPFTSADLKGT